MYDFRTSFLILAALLLGAADHPPPPAQLEPYIEDGHLNPADYGWIKGRFDDATPEDEEVQRALGRWQTQCRNAAIEEMREELARRGFPNVELQGFPGGPLLCRESGAVPVLAQTGSFAAFSAELDRARPVVESFIYAVRVAEEMSRPRSAELSELLERRTLGEQMVRSALFWGQGTASDAPELTPMGRAIAQARLGMEMARLDYANTAWLKSIVAEQGWPLISEVGPEASNEAWLLVQHADHDPAFQLDALRLMEPLVEAGEVSPRNYAYLYDRIMLKLNGRQRYGTQAGCPAGQLEAQPLEDEANVDLLREEVGLEPLADYIGGMRERNGPCRPAPQGCRGAVAARLDTGRNALPSHDRAARYGSRAFIPA